MGSKRLLLFMVVLALGCRTVSAGRSTASAATGASQVTPSETLNGAVTAEEKKQIDLNIDVLQTYSDEEKRVDAANLLLFNKYPYARRALIDALNLANNSQARMAVCKALIQTRTTGQEIQNKDDFIEPLLNIFSTKVDDEARLAADAILIYDYREVGPLLDQIVTDSRRPARTRINVIQALKKVWEKPAIIRLYSLVDDPDPEVSAEASSALRSLGFQPGTTRAERARIVTDIQNREIVEVLKDLLINQDKQINQQKADLESLRRFALSILDEAYQGIGLDDASKSRFLKKYLAPDSQTWVKSWALDKVRTWRATPQTSIPVDLEPVIIALVSDPAKEIRLKAVNLIGLLQPMRTVDLAAKLIAQFDVEQDDQVKIELLDKLGIACSTGLSQTSSIKITPETRQRVLGYASDFLSKDDPAKAGKGAKVIRQLIERDGMQDQEVKVYLSEISDRFNRQKQDPNNALVAELLNVMVGLAADSSACREPARKAFEPFFREALNYESDFVRETAIDGLGYVNKTEALKILRDRIDKERSERARSKIIDFARDVGGREDLDWLAGRLGAGTNAEAKQAWSAMLKIFDSMEIEALTDWETRLMSSGSIYNLSEQQKIEFLKKVLTKTPAGSKQKYQEQIASRSFAIGQYEQAANYYTLMYNGAANAEEKDRILPALLDSCLRTTNVKDAANFIMEYLSRHDFNPEDPVITSIDNYFRDSSVVIDKSAVLKSLKGITLSVRKPGWDAKLRQWTDLLTKTEPETPATPSGDAVISTSLRMSGSLVS